MSSNQITATEDATATTRASADAWTDTNTARALLGAEPFDLAYEVLARSGIADLVRELATNHRGRKQRGLTAVDVLAACIAASLQGRAPQYRELAKLLHHEMPAEQRLARNITRPWPTTEHSGPEHRRMVRAAEEAVRRRYDGLAKAVDTYDGPRNKRMGIDDLIDVAQHNRSQDPAGAVAEAKRKNLLRLMNGLLQGSLDLVPSDLQAQMGTAIAVDGTFIPTWASGPKGHRPYQKALEAVDNVPSDRATTRGTDGRTVLLKALERDADAVVSADPEAGWYTREDADGRTETKGFGFEGHLAVTTNVTDQTNSVKFPSVVVGMSIDTPACAPDKNAIDLAAEVMAWSKARGINFRTGVFDALYPGLGYPGFRRPLRALGLMPVHRLREKQLGKSGSTYEGLMLLEGAWYCEQMPKHLVNASKDRVAGRVTDQQYQRLIEDRRRWQTYRISGTDVLDAHDKPKSHRHECPSSKRGGGLSCVRDPRTRGPQDLPLPVRPLPEGEAAPAACIHKTILIPADLSTHGMEQDAPYMTPEWRALNNRLRSTNEGKNGTAKDPTKEAIGTKGVRRVNGMAHNGIFLACQLAANNLRSLRTFLREAEVDHDGTLIRRYSPYRSRRQAAHRSTPTSARPATRSPKPASKRAKSARTATPPRP